MPNLAGDDKYLMPAVCIWPRESIEDNLKLSDRCIRWGRAGAIIMGISDSDGNTVPHDQSLGGEGRDWPPQNPVPPTPSPDQDEVHLHALMRESGQFRLRRPSPKLKLIAVLTAAVVLLVAVGIFLGSQWHHIRSSSGSPAASDQQSGAKLTPPLICTGIGDSGAPEGVSDSFTEDQVQRTGIGVFLTYSGAVPQKTTFQMRWTIEDKIYETRVQTLDHKADTLYMKLGKEVPPGTHAFEFLVDGKVQQTASLVIGSPSEPAPPVSMPDPTLFRAIPRPPPNPTPPQTPLRPAQSPTPSQTPARPSPRPTPTQAPPRASSRPAVIRPAQKEATRPAEPAVITPAPVAIPTVAAPQPETPEKPAEIHQPMEMIEVYQARHWHSWGSCTGELKLNQESIEFTSDQHTFKFDIKDVIIDRDGIQDPSGKLWHFLVADTNIEQVLGRWKRGELFPAPAPKPAAQATQIPQTPSGKATPAEVSQRRTYAARHKHTLVNCAGELTLTPEAIEFSSPQHYCKYQIGDVQIERDGFRGRDGNTWRFDVPGENVGELLRQWKAGKLFTSK